jgi:uncharacterized DUF497 family protein
MNFEWDENKAARNLSKHRVSFEEAKTVFDDSLYVDFYDPDHSEDEERYLIVGESNRGRLLIVSYTERGDVIRLISAREVTRAEREAYEEVKSEMEDELRSEYDLKSLRVRKLGSGRKSFGGTTVRLEPDVAEMFPNAEAVNEALRFLIRVMQENQAFAPKIQRSTSLERKDESP